ncbi:hypothetical protein ACFY9S_28195 [Streptomyces sp. NPDC012474]|uniref:hypothetical protein n=1 Tax=Streptomyces sp. NPDC012474 TaxID=3364836 RepID=UPI0036EAF2DF
MAAAIFFIMGLHLGQPIGQNLVDYFGHFGGDPSERTPRRIGMPNCGSNRLRRLRGDTGRVVEMTIAAAAMAH